MVEAAVLIAVYRLSRPDQKALVNNKFAKTKYHITPRHSQDKPYQVIIHTREECVKDWPERLRKRQVWFTDGDCDQEGVVAGECKWKSRRQWHMPLGQEATSF